MTLMGFSILFGAAIVGQDVNESVYGEYPKSFWLTFICMRSCYVLTALQPFVFGMRYLQSATRYALSKTCASLSCIHYATIITASFYSAVVIGLMLSMCLRYSDSGENYSHFWNWYYNVYVPCIIAQLYLLAILSLVNASITVTSVYKILQIIR
jgi:hypothetical protein